MFQEMTWKILGRRFVSSVAATSPSPSVATSGRMSSWQLTGYEATPRLVLNTATRIPTIERPDDILIEVHAASINPLDVQMAEGFGRRVIGAMRQIDQRTLAPVLEFPVTLGRDCSGVVVETGRNVTRFKPGDEVWCALAASRSGTFAQYVMASSGTVAPKPKDLNHVEAASIPYVACTVWSALRYAARLNSDNSFGLGAVVFGAAGGIGTFAVQLLNAWGANVTAVCRGDAFEMVKKLGAINTIDYTAVDAWQQLAMNGPYDFILDPVFNDLSQRSTDLLKSWRGSTYVSITNPLLDDCDEKGLALGFASSATKFSRNFLKCLRNGRVYAWAYVIPDGRILTEVTRLVEDDKIRPVVEKVFRFDELPSAFEKLVQGHARGKIVVEVVPSLK